MSSHICLRVHFIWSTRHREALIQAAWRDRLYGYLGGILRERDGVLLATGGTADHVHLYASLPATVSLAEMVNVIKSNSSSWVKQALDVGDGFAWQSGYGAFSVSPSLDEHVRTYLANQEEHHRRRSFQEEYLEFLDRHGIEYDPRYVFE